MQKQEDKWFLIRYVHLDKTKPFPFGIKRKNVKRKTSFQKISKRQLSRKHAYIILNPSTPFLYTKTGVYRDILVFLGAGVGGGGGARQIFRRGCAAGILNTPPIHIISRLTKHTYSYNLHVKRYPIHITE